MIQTFLIDIPVLILFGVLFSIFTRRDWVGGSVFSSPYFWHGLVFSTLFCALVLYSYFVFPEWMWMYFIEDARHTPLELVYIFVFIYYLPYVLGFYLGTISLSRSRLLWLGLVASMVASEVWIVAHLFDRYSVVGTRIDYLAGTAVSLFSPKNPLSIWMNLVMGTMAAYFLFVLWRYKKIVKIHPHESEF